MRHILAVWLICSCLIIQCISFGAPKRKASFEFDECPEVLEPNATDMIKEYVLKSRPFVLRGAANEHPPTWSNSKLMAEFGTSPVYISISDSPKFDSIEKVSSNEWMNRFVPDPMWTMEGLELPIIHETLLSKASMENLTLDEYLYIGPAARGDQDGANMTGPYFCAHATLFKDGETEPRPFPTAPRFQWTSLMKLNESILDMCKEESSWGVAFDPNDSVVTQVDGVSTYHIIGPSHDDKLHRSIIRTGQLYYDRGINPENGQPQETYDRQTTGYRYTSLHSPVDIFASRGSRFNAGSAGGKRAPDDKVTRGISCELFPGDSLYIPAFWWRTASLKKSGNTMKSTSTVSSENKRIIQRYFPILRRDDLCPQCLFTLNTNAYNASHLLPTLWPKEFGTQEAILRLSKAMGESSEIRRIFSQYGDQSKLGRNSLHILHLAALYNDHMKIANLLKGTPEPNADITDRDGWTALHIAAAVGSVHAAEVLLGYGANANAKTNQFHRTPLALATIRNHTSIVEVLIKNGALPDAVDYLGRSPLLMAAWRGYEDITKLLLEAGADVSHQDNGGAVALLAASVKNHTNIAKILLESGADVRQRDEDSTTPFHYVCSTGNVEIIRLMIDHDIRDIANKARQRSNTPGQLYMDDELPIWEIRDNYNKSPLQTAIFSGHVGAVELILEYGGTIDPDADLSVNDGETTLLHLVLQERMDDMAMLIINEGANCTSLDPEGRSPLMYAANSGNPKSVRRLLACPGVRADVIDSYGRTPLHQAAYHGYVDIVQDLIKAGASVDSKDSEENKPADVALRNDQSGTLKEILRRLPVADNFVNEIDSTGKTPLMWASLLNYPAVVKTLLEHGAEPTLRDDDGLTSLHYASHRGYTDVVNILLRQLKEDGENPAGDTDNQGRSPLHLAAFNGRLSTVQALLESGTDLNVQDHEGHTALHLAAYRGFEQVVELFLSKGADPNANNDKKRSVLHSAADTGEYSVIEPVINAGADINAGDSFGNTPLHVAVFYGHTEMVQELIRLGAKPNACNLQGHTPLFFAEKQEFSEIIKILRDMGVGAIEVECADYWKTAPSPPRPQRNGKRPSSGQKSGSGKQPKRRSGEHGQPRKREKRASSMAQGDPPPSAPKNAHHENPSGEFDDTFHWDQIYSDDDDENQGNISNGKKERDEL